MPAILRPQEYNRWLGDDPNPRDLLQSYPAETHANVADLDAGQQAGKR
jgi:putative SOS response-associated peptidase YedK